MFNKLKNYFNRKNLKDEKFSYLFDRPLDEEFVCFDCETTGLNPLEDDLTEVVYISAQTRKSNTITIETKWRRRNKFIFALNILLINFDF